MLTSSRGVPEFIHFCDSAGQWHEQAADESLLRFALTCFKLSGGDFMLAGLKGIRIDSVYYLTVPSLLSRTSNDATANECTKEYMKEFRKNTKKLMDDNGWTIMKPSKKGTAITVGEKAKVAVNLDVKAYLGFLIKTPVQDETRRLQKEFSFDDAVKESVDRSSWTLPKSNMLQRSELICNMACSIVLIAARSSPDQKESGSF